MALDKKYCNGCGETRKIDEFYSSPTPFNKATGRVSICKACIWDFVKPLRKNAYEMKLIHEALRMMDKPFLKQTWKSSENEAENRELDIFKCYMKNIAMNQNKSLTWNDSDFEISNKSPEDQKENNDEWSEDVSFSDSETRKLRKIWGEMTIDDYIFLESFYGEYENNFPTDTPAQVNIYRNLAKIHLQAEKELSKSNIKSFKDLMDLSSKMHTDGNIKPLQSSGMNDDKGLSTYGLWIKNVENDEPCEYFENAKVYEDYDGFKKYIDNWFVRPFKNIFNISKDFDVGDDK